MHGDRYQPRPAGRRCFGRRGRAGGCHGRRRTRVCRPGCDVQPLSPRFRGQPAGPRRGHAPGRLGGLPCPLCGRHGLAAADRRILHTRAARRRAGPLRNHQGLRHRPGSRGAGVRRHRGLVPERRRRRARERLARAGNRVPVAGRHRGSAGPPVAALGLFPGRHRPLHRAGDVRDRRTRQPHLAGRGRPGTEAAGPDSGPSTSARCRWRPRTFSPPTCSRRRSSRAGGGCWTGPPTAGTWRYSPSSAAGNCSRRRGSAPRGA